MVRMGILPGCLAGLVILAMTAQPMAQDKKADKPRVQQDSRLKPVSSRTAEEYSSVVGQVLKTISRDYHFEEISELALAGRALLGLYRAGSIVPPEALVRDPDRYFLGIPGNGFMDKLRLAREAVGDMPLIQGERGIHASLHAVFKSIDIFSNYSEVDAATRMTYEQGAGIGLFLEDKPLGGSYFVRNVTIDSPSHKQGIRPGDEILEIDGKVIPPSTTTAQVNVSITIGARMRKGVHLTIRNLQGVKKTIEVSTVRQNIDNSELVVLGGEFERDTLIQGYRPSGEGEWDFWCDYPHRIALIRLGTIQTPLNRIIDIINQLKEDGLKGLILDLRDCPSGVPDYSADLAGMFLKDDALVAKTKYRNPNADDTSRGERREYRASKESKHFLDLPVAVLIGPDTSGAAELIAAALQDAERAKIVGQRSRGKSTIQSTNSREQPNPYGVRFSYRLTVGVFMRPSGKNLHRMPGATTADDWGVRPDVEVILPAQMRRQVRAWWFEHDTRPVDSLDPTKIDDLKNDPVLATAVKLLSK